MLRHLRNIFFDHGFGGNGGVFAFRLDGDENTVRSVCDGESLQMQVRCPAYFNAPPSAHPARQITERFCDCCIRLNTGILREAGYALMVQKTGTGTCEWRIRKEENP